jgi:hypothetical protein
VFRLFDIGLQFFLRQLWESRRELLGFGPVQVGLRGVALGSIVY